MKILKWIGSTVFVVGIFVLIFIGIPWYTYHQPLLPWWLKTSMYLLIGGIILIMVVAAPEGAKKKEKLIEKEEAPIPILSSSDYPGYKISSVLGLVQGHTIYAIWIGKDISAIVKLVLGGELKEYSDMMGKARKIAINRMTRQARELGADAVISARLTTASVVGSAAELLAYGTAVKIKTQID